MPVSIIVGLQWGDEGKGKMVDHLAERATVVARFSGGSNAGHTVEADGKKFALHLLPSGLVRENVIGMIGAACVMDPVTILKEIETLAKSGISVVNRLKISGKINLTHPGYRLIEKRAEMSKKDSKIGTTGRGIGPTYERKVRRNAIRLEDVFDIDVFKKLTDFHTQDIISSLKLSSVEIEKLNTDVEEFINAAKKISVYSENISLALNTIINEGKLVIAEGAQGSLLDPDHGSYPFVTCGQCVSGAACSSLGFGPTKVSDVIGILKAYTTRVGSGPFPTELEGDIGKKIRQAGHEFGTTTGRPRRCGWLDLVLAKYSVILNGCTSVTLTLLDVLTGFDELKVCTAYKNDSFSTGRAMGSLVPVYETISGWSEDISGQTDWNKLPNAAQKYVLKIEEFIGIPIASISTGPGRDDVIWR